MEVSNYITVLFLFVLIFVTNVESASGGSTKGHYVVYDSETHNPCVVFDADINLSLGYYTNEGQDQADIHVPTTSTVNEELSSCDTTIFTSGLSIQSQVLTIDFYHLAGWQMSFAFTKDNNFRTDKEKQYVLYQVNITANYSAASVSFPNAKDEAQLYYLPIDHSEISEIAGSIYAESDHSYYCNSEEKYVINKDSTYGPTAYVTFSLMTIQAYKTSEGTTFDAKEICPSDQSTTDILPIIVAGILAVLMVSVVILYLVYRMCSPEETNLVASEAQYENEGLSKDEHTEL